MLTRKTLSESVSRTALGVRSGLQIILSLHPAPMHAGLQLYRTDVRKHWPISPATALPGAGCTAVGDHEHQVLFIEHLVAALAAAGVTDAVIEVSGPEIPLFEGGAVALWDMIQTAGTEQLDVQIKPLLISEAVVLSTPDYFLAALPSETAAYYYLFTSTHSLIGCQWASYLPGQDDFATHLAPARTFIDHKQAHAARQSGTLKGGSEQNAIIVYPDRLSETPTLPQAFARHKLLDLMGDLYLLGRPIQAHIIGSRSSHQQNHQLVRRLAEISQHEGNPALR